MSFIVLVLVIAATIAVFATTTAGRKIAKRIGLRDRVAGAATSEDVSYLLSACNGDLASLERRVEAERVKYPDLNEAEHYRRAIRKVFTERESEDPGTR
jgi:hypothetical protein